MPTNLAASALPSKDAAAGLPPFTSTPLAGRPGYHAGGYYIPDAALADRVRQEASAEAARRERRARQLAARIASILTATEGLGPDEADGLVSELWALLGLGMAAEAAQAPVAPRTLSPDLAAHFCCARQYEADMAGLDGVTCDCPPRYAVEFAPIDVTDPYVHRRIAA